MQAELIDAACQPFDDPRLRTLLKDLWEKSSIIIDEITVDDTRSGARDMDKASSGKLAAGSTQ